MLIKKKKKKRREADKQEYLGRRENKRITSLLIWFVYVLILHKRTKLF